MSFSFSFVAIKRERKERKERENTLPLPTLLRAFNQMDVAGRACSLTLAIGAMHVNILSASISKMQKFIFSIQACLKVTFHVRTHARGAIVVLEIKYIKKIFPFFTFNFPSKKAARLSFMRYFPLKKVGCKFLHH